jgi:hypothetical protein
MWQVTHAMLVCTQRLRPYLLLLLLLLCGGAAVGALGSHAALAGLPRLPPEA